MVSLPGVYLNMRQLLINCRARAKVINNCPVYCPGKHLVGISEEACSICLASFPRPHLANDGKLGKGLGTRLVLVDFT